MLSQKNIPIAVEYYLTSERMDIDQSRILATYLESTALYAKPTIPQFL